MCRDADEGYRVQISGPGFSVSKEVIPDEDDEDLTTAHFVSYAICDALAMASHSLPRMTQILANVVRHLHDQEACGIRSVRRAEDAFCAAAEHLENAWAEHDLQRQREGPA